MAWVFMTLKVLLIVNTKTACGFTKELEKLYQKYHQKGNFTKFLVDKLGNALDRFASNVTPKKILGLL